MKCYLERHQGIDKLCYRNRGRVRLNIVARDQYVKPYDLDRLKVNAKNQADKYIDNYKNENGFYPPASTFKMEFRILRDRKIESMLLLDYYRQFVREKKIELNIPAKKRKVYEQIDNIIQDFQTYTGKTFTLYDFNKVWVDEFHNFMRTKRTGEKILKKDGGKYNSLGGLAQTTIESRYSVLRTFSWWLSKSRYLDYEEEISKKIKKLKSADYQSKKYVLNIDELNLISGLVFENEVFNIILEYFEFLCHTSLRYSDFETLTWNHIKRIGTGYEIRKISVKTGKEFRVRLNDRALTILLKHKPQSPNQPIFNKFTGNDFNRKIKVVLAQTGLFNEESDIKGEDGNYKKNYDLICSSCGRHTFVNIALDLGIPHHDIMTATGHQAMRSFEYYIRRFRRSTDFTSKFVYNNVNSPTLRDWNQVENSLQVSESVSIPQQPYPYTFFLPLKSP